MKTVLTTAAALALTAALAAPAATAAAPPTLAPCETQRELFDKYNIQIDMYAPAVSWAYTTACSVTG
jgi:hypothetical protein